MRYTCQLVLILFISACIGCTISKGTFDHRFAAYGGLRDRLDRVHGRVGSVLDPAASLEPVRAVDEPASVDNLFDLPQDDLADEFDDGVRDEAVDEGFSDELRKAIEEAQESLPPAMEDET